MGDLERQLRQLADHRGAQVSADEAMAGPSTAVHSRHRSPRQFLLVAAVLVFFAVGGGWLAARGGPSETLATAPASSTLTTTVPQEPTTAAHAPPADSAGIQPFESTLGFAVDLPDDWGPDSSPISETYLNAMVGTAGGIFRAVAWDRPNRSPFVDFVERFLPDFDQVSKEFVVNFPDEFGASPTLEPTPDGMPIGVIIRPSDDAVAPAGVTYLFELPLWITFRFLEIVVDDVDADAIMNTFSWLPEPADSRIGKSSEVVTAAENLVRRFAEELSLGDRAAAGLLVSNTHISDSEFDHWVIGNQWLLDGASLGYSTEVPRFGSGLWEVPVIVVRSGPEPRASAIVVSVRDDQTEDPRIIGLQGDGPVPDPPPGSQIDPNSVIQIEAIPADAGVGVRLDGVELETANDPIAGINRIYLSRWQSGPEQDTAVLTIGRWTRESLEMSAFAYRTAP